MHQRKRRFYFQTTGLRLYSTLYSLAERRTESIQLLDSEALQIAVLQMSPLVYRITPRCALRRVYTSFNETNHD